MSIEYLGVVASSEKVPTLPILRKILDQIELVEIVKEQESTLSILYPRGSSEVNEWGEDACLEILARGIYLVFHSSTENDRELFVNRLTQQFKNIGITISFEED